MPDQMTVKEAILWERDLWPSQRVREALDVLKAAGVAAWKNNPNRRWVIKS